MDSSKLREFWAIYSQSKTAIVGLVLTVFFLLMAVLANVIAPSGPYAMSRQTFIPPSMTFVFGSDDLGRDILSQIIYGSRVSMLVGFTTSIVATIIGILFGSISAYFGGMVDRVLMGITDLFMAIPRLPFAMILVSLLGPGLINLVIVLVLLYWTSCARLIRGEFLYSKEQEYVIAAQGLGVSSLKIIFNEILPNAIPPAVVNMTMQVGAAILMEASLSFLGFGDPNVMSWGYIIKNGYLWLRYAWWPVVFPGMAIFLTVLGFNLLGDGLNDTLNPRLRSAQHQGR